MNHHPLHRAFPRQCDSCPMVHGYGGEGRGCKCSNAATAAIYRAIWSGISKAVRSLDVADWLALASLFCAVMAIWSN